MFFEICVLNNFANFTGKHLCWSLFIIKFLINFIRDIATLVFSCEIWKNLKNTFSTEHLQWLLLSKEIATQVFTCNICKIFKNTFFYRTPPVAASEWTLLSSGEKVPSFWLWCNSILSFKTILSNETS